MRRPMRRIEYFVTCGLWLSLEDYWNAGLDRGRAREIIEQMPDPGSATLNLRCEDSHVNGNWNVRTSSTSPEVHDGIVAQIRDALDAELRRATPNPIRREAPP